MKNNRTKYDKQFKINAIEHKRSTGKSASQVERDLGIPQGNLSRWIREYNYKEDNAFAGNGKSLGPEAENKELRRQLAIVTQEREILKKAMGIFTGPIK